MQPDRDIHDAHDSDFNWGHQIVVLPDSNGTLRGSMLNVEREKSEFRIGAYAGVVNQFERTDPTRSTTANFVPRQWRVVPHSLLVPSNR